MTINVKGIKKATESNDEVALSFVIYILITDA